VLLNAHGANLHLTGMCVAGQECAMKAQFLLKFAGLAKMESHCEVHANVMKYRLTSVNL
jgi:hypothetical protein